MVLSPQDRLSIHIDTQEQRCQQCELRHTTAVGMSVCGKSIGSPPEKKALQLCIRHCCTSGKFLTVSSAMKNCDKCSSSI